MKKILILSMLFCACAANTGDLPTEDVQYAQGDAVIGPIIVPSQDITEVAEETNTETSNDTIKTSRDSTKENKDGTNRHAK